MPVPLAVSWTRFSTQLHTLQLHRHIRLASILLTIYILQKGSPVFKVLFAALTTKCTIGIFRIHCWWCDGSPRQRAATAAAALLDAANPPRSRNNILSFCFFNPRNGPEPTLEPVYQDNNRFSVSSKQDDLAADQAPDWDRPRLGHQQEPSCCVVAATREGF